MLCYKDMTFCSETGCSNAVSCKRIFTEKDHQEASKWWGNENYPVAFFVDKPACYEEKK